MPSIKKSTLEQKLPYRIINVVLSILPWVAAAIYLKRYVAFPDISQINTFDLLQQNIHDLAQKSGTYFVYVAVGLVVYFVLLGMIRKGVLYIAFGGVEDDTVKNSPVAGPLNTPSAHPTPANANSALAILIVIIIVGVILAVSFSLTDSKPTTTGGGGSGGGGGGGGTTKCVATGCGTLWRCTGSFYYPGAQTATSVDSCFPTGSRPGDLYSGWSGTCRQCP